MQTFPEDVKFCGTGYEFSKAPDQVARRIAEMNVTRGLLPAAGKCSRLVAIYLRNPQGDVACRRKGCY